MKFWRLFSVPEGKEITEKNLYRVLISSLCTIFLCMGCLAGTTWAWFAVSIENPENVIQVAVPSVVVSTDHPAFLSEAVGIDTIEIESETEFPAGEYLLTISHPGEGDVFDQKSNLYVTFSVDEVVMGYMTLNYDNNYETQVILQTEQDCVVTWVVSWFQPENAEPVADDLIYWYAEEEETESTEESTDPTEESTDPTEETTEPTEETTEPTEETTEPTEETTAPTEETTVPTEAEKMDIDDQSEGEDPTLTDET